MMVKQLRSAIVAKISVAMLAGAAIVGGMIALTTAPVWAFSQQTLTPNGNYNFDYTPDDKTKFNDSSTTKSDPNSPGLHFSIEHGQTGPFGFQSPGNSATETWDRFSKPIGNGN
jgi:hypothetical protein